MEQQTFYLVKGRQIHIYAVKGLRHGRTCLIPSNLYLVMCFISDDENDERNGSMILYQIKPQPL